MRGERLALLDVYELDDDPARTADVLKRLANLAQSCGARVLVTDGVPATLAGHLAHELDLRHEPYPVAGHDPAHRCDDPDEDGPFIG
jgi:hypothetical protein